MAKRLSASFGSLLHFDAALHFGNAGERALYTHMCVCGLPGSLPSSQSFCGLTSVQGRRQMLDPFGSRPAGEATVMLLRAMETWTKSLGKS